MRMTLPLYVLSHECNHGVIGAIQLARVATLNGILITV